MFAAVSGHPQVSTAFTYQGELTENDSPASGTFDFQFLLFDTASNGTATHGPVTVEDVSVHDGIFTTAVDFGADVFGNTDHWLEIRVRDGDSTGEFTILGPRQQIRPAPLALHAQNVGADAVESAQIADREKSRTPTICSNFPTAFRSLDRLPDTIGGASISACPIPEANWSAMRSPGFTTA
jgi:hypothetical protein